MRRGWALNGGLNLKTEINRGGGAGEGSFCKVGINLGSIKI